MDASNVKSLELLKKQADWCLAMNDPKSAWYVQYVHFICSKLLPY